MSALYLHQERTQRSPVGKPWKDGEKATCTLHSLMNVRPGVSPHRDLSEEAEMGIDSGKSPLFL